MKRKIAIVAGGDSSEYVVSLKSAEGIDSFISSDRYEKYLVIIRGKEWYVQFKESRLPIDKNDFGFVSLEGEKIIFDFAYITIHGTPGENGVLQGYFDLIGLPYSSCSVLSSALTFSKFTCNQFLKPFGVKVADAILLRKGMTISAQDVDQQLGWPVFVKPNGGGSSFATTKVKVADDLPKAIEDAFAEGGEVLIESYIQGTELTCGCYKTASKAVVLPITETIPDNEFFDFDAKYNGQVEEVTPARISKEWTDQIQQLTSAIYDIIGAKGIIRVDYILSDDGLFLLEVNTTPGMTTTSFIPQQVRAAGLNMSDVMSNIIEEFF